MSYKSIGYEIRSGEISVECPVAVDAGLHFIGRIETPWRERRECPRRGAVDGPICRIVVASLWRPALQGLVAGGSAQILYWMHQARRDLVIQAPGDGARLFGTFALRSPVRPNPIASSIVVIEALADDGLLVRGLDCLDDTPLLDIKPVACPQWPPQ
jgi:tRNA-Thr(GGU) m(6)t(6)A37 methyltransferase TsaA